MATPSLVNTRYVPPGSYIGQLITPSPGSIQSDARLPAYIGVGSRLAVGRNVGIRRSYVYGAELSFTGSAPFIANLPHNATGDQVTARLFKSDGTEVRKDNWAFRATGNDLNQVLINTEVYDNTASYRIDYQSSDRDVRDPIPLDDIREIIAVGTTPDAPEFKEYQHYYIVSTITAPAPEDDSSVANDTTLLQAPTADGANTGTGTVAQATASSYTHNYNRFYVVRCTAVGGTTPNRTATFAWSATPTSGGNATLPGVPLNPAQSEPTFTISEASVPSLTQPLELGIQLLFAFGATNFVANDLFTFNALGPALIEADSRHANTNQYASLAVVPGLQPGSTGTMAFASDAAYTGTFNNKIRLQVTAIAGSTPNRTATFVWQMYGDNLGVNGTFIANEAVAASLTQTLTLGTKIVMTFGGTQFVVGDLFTITMNAPKIFYTAKDDRTYTVSITAKTSPSSGNGHVEASYTTNTPEGSFGTFVTDANTTSPVSPSHRTGHVLLPDNVNLFMRNMVGGPISATVAAGNRFTVNDVFQFSALDDDLIAWDLIEKSSETIQLNSVATDVAGVVTGVPGTKYVILNHIPTNVTSVLDSSIPTPQPLSYVLVANSPYMYFPVAPTSAITVAYEWRSQEPDPGQLYYFTAKYLRPDEMYNTPQLVATRQQGRDLLAPSTVLNHLYIMNEVAFDAGAAGAFFIQVKDADMDGMYTDIDFEEGILASETSSRITDLVVLGHFTSLSASLASVDRMNDPFARRERLLWVGAPTGTPIGSAEQPNTLLYLSQRTLQVYGDSPSHGTRILAGSTTAKRNLRLEDGTTAEVTVDGSFLAGTLAAVVSSFTDPGETILRKQLPGWSFVETFGDLESPTNAQLGANNIVFFTDIGSGVYRIEEDVTVDTFAPDFNLINNMTQKQFVTRYVRTQTDTNLVAIVVPSAEAGVGLIKGFLVGTLTSLAGKVVGQYQNQDGTERPLDPDSDVVVFRDALDPTKYHYLYAYYLKNTIKRLFGLYSVNTNDFGLKR